MLPQGYIITDSAQYENIRETSYYQKVEKYSSLVMPERIDSFCEVQEYLFTYDPWMNIYQEFLEVSIEGELQYQEYCTILLNGADLMPCSFDLNYQEYVINDEVGLTTNNEGEQRILWANIQKILVNNSEQSIVFIVISVPSNYGPISPQDFKYFVRFNALDKKL